MKIFERFKSEGNKESPELVEKKTETVSVVKRLFDRISKNLDSIADTIKNGGSNEEPFSYAAQEFTGIKPLVPKTLRKINPTDWEYKGVERASDEKNEYEHLEMRELAEDGNFVIWEKISRTVDLEKITENYRTELELIDIKNNVAVNLNELLPPGFTFTPTSLERIEMAKTGSSAKLKKIPGLSLDKYSYYTTGKIDEFSEFPLLKKVYYGNLKKMGGRISLFHEISHAWQFKNKKRPSFVRIDFEELSSRIRESLGILSVLMKAVERGKIVQENFEEVVSNQVKILKEIGTEIPAGMFDMEKNEPTEYNLQVKIESNSDNDSSWVPIKNEALGKSLSFYEAEERDAWANALRLLRSFREVGFDPEPSLKDVDAFRKVMQPCLTSYEESVPVRFSKLRTPFARRIQK